MNITVVSPFNPSEFTYYLDKGQVIPDINKAASSVHALIQGYLKAGHHITVISSYDEEGAVRHISGTQINIYLVSSFSRLPKADTFRKWYMVKRLRKELSKHLEETDVIHAQWTYEYALAAAAFAHQLPVFCTIRDWAPVIRQHQLNVKAKLMWRLVSEPLFKRVMSNRHIHFIANSAYIHKLVQETYPKAKCSIIGNPIKSSLIIEERNFYPKSPVYVSITQDLSEGRKNYHRLLQAFTLLNKDYPDAKLVLIGKIDTSCPPYTLWVEEGITKNVEFKGFLAHDALTTILDQASALVHPSLEESFGNTLLEGFARRLPVIGGKDSGAVPQVLGQGKYGLLCDVANPQELMETMKKALDTKEVLPLLARATAFLKEEQTDIVIAEKHVRLFSQAL